MKDYKNWTTLKTRINNGNRRPDYKQREVWWCSIGENVGFEEDGKNLLFNRPVLILRKFGHGLFWGIPLSTTQKRGKYHYEFKLNNKTSVALLSQLRTFDSTRLNNGRISARIGILDKKTFDNIQQKIHQLVGSIYSYPHLSIGVETTRRSLYLNYITQKPKEP